MVTLNCMATTTCEGCEDDENLQKMAREDRKISMEM